MAEQDRHNRRRSRYEHSPDPDDRYDPRQGAKRAKTAELSPDLGPPRRPHHDADFSDRYEPQVRPDISERSESTRRSRSKERAHSSRDRREHTSSRSYRDHDASRSRHRSYHSPERGMPDRQNMPDSREAAGSSAPRSPRPNSNSRHDQTEPRAGWQGSDMGGRGPGGFSDRGGFGRGGPMPGRGFGRGRGHFDDIGFQGQGSTGDWGLEGGPGGMSEGGRGGRGGFVPRGGFRGGGRFGGRFEGGAGRMEGRFAGSFRGRGPPFRGRGERAGDGAPMPFSRGQEGPLETGPNRAPPGPGRGAFPHGGLGPPPLSDRQPSLDPATKRRRDANESVRRRQQYAQLRIDFGLVSENFRNAQIKQYLDLSKLPEDVPDKFPIAPDSVQLTSAYMYPVVHSEQQPANPAASKSVGVDRAAFDAAVELYQRPHAAQWMRASQHGNFKLTSAQIMTHV